MEVLWVSLVLIPCVMSARICDSLLLTAPDDSVTCTTTEPAILGGNVTLTCILLNLEEVLQVTWCKIKGNEYKDLAASSTGHGQYIYPEFSAFTSFILLDPDAHLRRSAIVISKLEKEDEACYGCYFNIKLSVAVHGVICLKDIGISYEFTCSASGTDLGIFMNPPEIKTRTSEHDVKGNPLLKGRYSDPNINPACIFVSQAAGGKSEGPDEVVDVHCSASGREISHINWNNTENSVVEHKTTDGNVTTVSSSLQIPRSSLSPEQRVSCNGNHTTEGNSDNMVAKAVRGRIWTLLAVALVVAAAAAVYIWKKHKISSQNSEDRTSDDELQLKTTEGTPIKVFSKNNTDETPEKDFGGKKTENDDLLTKTKSYYPRKLEFDF